MNKQQIIEKLKELKIDFDPKQTNKELLALLDSVEKQVDNISKSEGVSVNSPDAVKTTEEKEEDLVKQLIAKVQNLEKKDAENQEKLKMLYDVADKGRIYNYESKTTQKKPFKVHLSVFDGDYVVGWRTLKDDKIFHPQTGKQVGEIQAYEIKLLKKDGSERVVNVNGYNDFSNARYSERIEAEVVGKKEDWDGKTMFDIKLPDGRIINLDCRYIN